MRPWERVDVDDLAFIREGGATTRVSADKPFSFEEEFVLPEGGLDLEALNQKIIRLALIQRAKDGDVPAATAFLKLLSK